MNNPTTSAWHWSRYDYTDTRYPNALVNACGKRYATTHLPADAELLIKYFRGTLIGFALCIANQHRPKGLIFTRFLKLMGGKDQTETMMKLHLAFQSGWDGDDIYNEMVVIFLETAAAFNGTGTFVGYINQHLPYAISYWVIKHQRDASNYIKQEEECYEDE